MKKLFLSLGLIAIASFAYADIDHSMEFVDAQGNTVADGSVINRTEIETDAFGVTTQISSGLYAKNMTSGVVNIGFTVVIENLPSGKFSHCFPGNCKTTPEFPAMATYPILYQVDERKVGGSGTSIKAGEQTSLQSEWYIEEGKYGTCVVNYQFHIYEVDLTTYEYKFKADGSRVTVNYIYTDPAGINANVADKKLNSVAYYDLSGRRVSAPKNGVYVKKMTYADGTVLTNKVSLK